MKLDRALERLRDWLVTFQLHRTTRDMEDLGQPASGDARAGDGDRGASSDDLLCRTSAEIGQGERARSRVCKMLDENGRHRQLRHPQQRKKIPRVEPRQRRFEPRARTSIDAPQSQGVGERTPVVHAIEPRPVALGLAQHVRHRAIEVPQLRDRREPRRLEGLWEMERLLKRRFDVVGESSGLLPIGTDERMDVRIDDPMCEQTAALAVSKDHLRRGTKIARRSRDEAVHSKAHRHVPSEDAPVGAK